MLSNLDVFLLKLLLKSKWLKETSDFWNVYFKLINYISTTMTFHIKFWWLVRVTLVVAFGFCPNILLENECSLSGVDNHM